MRLKSKVGSSTVVGVLILLLVLWLGFRPGMWDVPRMVEARSEIRGLWTLWAGSVSEERISATSDNLDSLVESLNSTGSTWQPVAGLKGKIDDSNAGGLVEVDPWGTPYQYLMVGRGLAIRSAGRDREFSADGYVHGGFPYDDAGSDLVLVSGKWIAWPEAPRQENWFDSAIRESAREEQKRRDSGQ